MEKLRSEVQQMLQQIYFRKNEDDFETDEKRPFSIRIDETTHIMLENIARNLEMTKANVARMILSYGSRAIFEEFQQFLKNIGAEGKEDELFNLDFPLHVITGSHLKDLECDDE